jgi:hypothetical protein
MVGQLTLDQPIGVRIPVPQPKSLDDDQLIVDQLVVLHILAQVNAR